MHEKLPFTVQWRPTRNFLPQKKWRKLPKVHQLLSKDLYECKHFWQTKWSRNQVESYSSSCISAKKIGSMDCASHPHPSSIPFTRHGSRIHRKNGLSQRGTQFCPKHWQYLETTRPRNTRRSTTIPTLGAIHTCWIQSILNPGGRRSNQHKYIPQRCGVIVPHIHTQNQDLPISPNSGPATTSTTSCTHKPISMPKKRCHRHKLPPTNVLNDKVLRSPVAILPRHAHPMIPGKHNLQERRKSTYPEQEPDDL